MVSVIIPIYNVENYIGACLKSVAEQTYSDYEILLVDDCCTDRSILFVDKFLQQSSIAQKVKIFHHQYNRGLSAARNTGIDAARGKFIYFMDSDDTIAPNCLEKLVIKAEQTDAEVVYGNITIINDQGKSQGLKLKISSVTEMEGNMNIFHSYLNDKYYMMAWNKLIKRDFLIQHNLSFVEGLIHEDCAWSFTVACLTKKIAFVYEDTYNYLVRSNSIQTDKDFTKHFNAYCTLLKYYVDEAVKYGKANDPEFRWWLERKKALHFGQTLRSGTKEQLYQIYAIIRKNFPMKGWDKMRIHYQFPAWLGILAYKKWHGMWMI